ncbi:LLM class flavin-dependent oxidoreductase [Streptomyces violaceoruber]|uniref:LLM class flavin-dependent oxidoreductase n=1 Tax=Streptomyces violaceoruber TaxID=1935 RepID=A0ACD4WXP0_STRVN|nr:LLM class flavin-dependent oxidoreductase [Streptomyces violaceoruber]
MLLLTVAAAATGRVRLNTSTLSTFHYEPPQLARQPTTLDVLSDGRLGAGVGWGGRSRSTTSSATRTGGGAARRSTVLHHATGPARTRCSQDEGASRLWSTARRAAEDAGRDPDALRTAMRINLEPGTSVDSVADQLLDFAARVIERTGRL